MSSVKGEYSTWTAAMGATLHARRSDAAEHSLRPRRRILPSFWSCAMAATVSLTGVDLLSWWQ
jgi:hypothetical protein